MAKRSGSTLAQVMACCLTAPSHYLNQCWLIISKIQLHVMKISQGPMSELLKYNRPQSRTVFGWSLDTHPSSLPNIISSSKLDFWTSWTCPVKFSCSLHNKCHTPSNIECYDCKKITLIITKRWIGFRPPYHLQLLFSMDVIQHLRYVAWFIGHYIYCWVVWLLLMAWCLYSAKASVTIMIMYPYQM